MTSQTAGRLDAAIFERILISVVAALVTSHVKLQVRLAVDVVVIDTKGHFL